MFVAAHNGARIWGGAERATTRLLAGLQGRGHRVILYCNRPLVAENAAKLGVPTEILPLGGDVALPHALRFARRLRRNRPDALIVGTYKKLFLAALGARLAGVPRTIARVGLETDVPRSWKYRVALGRWVDAVVVTAARMREPFLTVGGLRAGQVVVIPNAAPRPANTPGTEAAREILGLPLDVPIVGAVARLDSQKRLDRMLRAVSELSPDVHCVLAGDGPERAALEALASARGIQHRTRFLGHRNDPGTVYAALDLMVISSDREGMSNAMLEAMAAGVPVVSTPVSGAEDALGVRAGGAHGAAVHSALAATPEGAPSASDAPPGVLLQGFGEEELTATLRSLLGDPGRLRAMGAAARARARAEFDFEVVLDRWEALLGVPSPAAGDGPGPSA